MHSMYKENEIAGCHFYLTVVRCSAQHTLQLAACDSFVYLIFVKSNCSTSVGLGDSYVREKKETTKRLKKKYDRVIKN